MEMNTNPSDLKPADFPSFPLLPGEIRRQIWHHCLPHRVVRILQSYYEDGCGRRIQLHRRRQPPWIAQVCRESRAVALEYGALRDNSSDESYHHDKTDRAWVDSSTDVVLIDGSFNHSKMRVAGHLLNMALHAEQVALALWLFLKPGRVLGFMTGNARRRMVYGEEYVVHASYAQAVEAGLFGLWVEERVVLVDAADAERLARFKSLPCRAVGEGHWKGFGELPLTPERVRRHLEFAWLECHMHVVPQDEYMSVYILDETDALEGFNYEHQWVKDMLARMPSFDVVVLFQLCTHQVHLDNIGD